MAEPTGSFADAAAVDAALNSALSSVVPVPGATDSFRLVTDGNYVDPGVTGSVVLGSGRAAFPNRIGVSGSDSGTPLTYARPIGTAGDAYLSWAADTGYVAGSASYAFIPAGYDNVCNAIGSTVIGDHHMIASSAGGHSSIIGESYCYIGPDVERGAILASHQCEITVDSGSSYHNAIFASVECRIDTTSSAYNSIFGSYLSQITGADSDNSAIFGGRGCTISASDYAATIGGYFSEITGGANYAVTIGGYRDKATAAYAVAIGGGRNEANHAYSVVYGDNCASLFKGAIHHNAKPLKEPSDCMSVSLTFGIRTESASLKNLACSVGTSDYAVMPAGKIVAGTFTIRLIGMRDGSADGNNDGNYSVASYVTSGTLFWDGTNGYFAKSGTETALTSAPVLDLDLISGRSVNAFTPAVAPQLAINTGAFRVKAAAIDGSAIVNWVASVDLALTLMS